ncbi:PepSY domain-containing protein [Paenibacillus silvae]|uniref:PepSY domain-containing protein n=1 Tax=Paenibacillus silvae TaxID=1325358 RepID=UPI0020052BD8|nr:PepSY domain-containing protein [Paenibacillus silvae]MCK6150395.1 PepSY domain-containing protein [Paenibacillus silvae]MCK6268693.1 PepSY domain-containing protein [Paenibacillus silvae]
MMNKHKLWIGSLSAAVLLGGSAVAASGNINGQPAPKVQSVTTQSAASTTPSVTSNQSSTGKLLTIAQAKEIALKAVEGKVDDVDLERRNGQTFYEVEIDRKGSPDVNVRLDAYTGKILAIVNDDDDDNDNENRGAAGSSSSTAVSNQVKLTAAQASNIALKQVSGGKVTKVELDREHGRYVYEIELRTAQGEADVDIDANTGKVLSVDQDFDDED